VADEIERKFLVPAVPEGLGAGTRVRQGYLALDGAVEVRLRLVHDGPKLTVKAGAGLVRTEVDLPVGEGEAEALWPHTAGRRVEKVRHLVPLAGGATAEVDVYEGDLAGLCVVEVEFADESEARTFEPPTWFGEELTGRPGWSNAELARAGRPATP
jgi:CYTH domain-containing protein